MTQESNAYLKTEIVKQVQEWCDTRESNIRKLSKFATDEQRKHYKAQIDFIYIVKVNIERIVKEAK
jgi:inactivated superfamily I helicase